MGKSDDSGDLEETITGKSTTSAMRAVKRSLAEEKIHDEYRDRDLAKLAKSVYSTRARVDTLEKGQLKIEQAMGLIKWIGGVVGGGMLTAIVVAMMKLFSGS